MRHRARCVPIKQASGSYLSRRADQHICNLSALGGPAAERRTRPLRPPSCPVEKGIAASALVRVLTLGLQSRFLHNAFLCLGDAPTSDARPTAHSRCSALKATDLLRCRASALQKSNELFSPRMTLNEVTELKN